jgi:hypothetical protein
VTASQTTTGSRSTRTRWKAAYIVTDNGLEVQVPIVEVGMPTP